MKTLGELIRRNSKLFFKDKGLFFTSLITPVILMVLYVTFLSKVYRDAFLSAAPQFGLLPEKLIDGAVGGQLLSSLLAVSCVTVCFCSNMLSVQDKVTGARRDLNMTPVSPSVLALGYYLSTLFSTMAVCLVAFCGGLVYLAVIGWYLSVADVLLILADILLVTMFGTALSSVVNCFLTTQGQISAVGTIVSSGYGFLCGAYMPISNFPVGLQNVISLLPGTYGTSLFREHCMQGAFEAMKELQVPEEAVREMADTLDANLFFFGSPVSTPVKYGVMIGTTVLLIGVFILLTAFRRSKK